MPSRSINYPSTPSQHEGFEPYLVHQFPQNCDARGPSNELYFPFPPFPALLEADSVVLSSAQKRLLSALADWHWRFSPSNDDLHAVTGMQSPRTLRRVLLALRTLGIVEWIDGQPRTLHLTPRGQMLCGIYVGAVRTNTGERLETYDVDSSPNASRANSSQQVALKRLWGIRKEQYVLRKVPISQAAFSQWNRRRFSPLQWIPPRLQPPSRRSIGRKEED